MDPDDAYSVLARRECIYIVEQIPDFVRIDDEVDDDLDNLQLRR